MGVLDWKLLCEVTEVSQIVTLSLEEVRVCALLGMERWLMKFGSEDRPNYLEGKKRGWLDWELVANVKANVAERAVSKLYGTTWNVPWYPNEEHPVRINHPDIGPNGEVRTIRTNDAIPVWPKDKVKGGYIIGARVLDPEYYSKVEVFGWLPVEMCTRDEWWSPRESDQCWRVPQDAFHDGNPFA